ncbi:hypothetical protein, unlikely [Trypanosoma congolense IL3000]|uniref:Protein yippee-like n=1 Tax=Trypanosoma congolense (strain IL3000) TaxID=1068625 RepID=F9W8V5_TRYCI|nr:hypothetical protein, unlikely [Trypanosoma congolense IL3000]
MVQRFRVLMGGSEGYSCRRCGAHLCDVGDVISREFRGKHGKAYLVNRCFNFYFGPPEEKELRTGKHIVRDTFCSNCDAYFGWTYDFAYEDKQRYKISRFVMERKLLQLVSVPPPSPTGGEVAT